MNDINEWLSPEGCSKATYQRIKGNFYDYQLENFERRKETSSPDELRQYIAERKKVCNDEIVRLSPFIESHENTKCIISCLNWFLKFYHYEEEKLKKPAPRVQSFSWTGSPEQLQKLYYGLTDGFIDPSKTDLQAFTAIFADELTGCQPIKWRASNRLLAYLFNQMFAYHFIVKEWQSIIDKNKLFQNKSGNFIKAHDLTSALTEINDPQKGLNPKGSEKIDAILKTLK